MTVLAAPPKRPPSTAPTKRSYIYNPLYRLTKNQLSHAQKELSKLRAFCERKPAYERSKTAREAAAKQTRLQQHPHIVYQCPHCGKFHISSKTQEEMDMINTRTLRLKELARFRGLLYHLRLLNDAGHLTSEQIQQVEASRLAYLSPKTDQPTAQDQ